MGNDDVTGPDRQSGSVLRSRGLLLCGYVGMLVAVVQAHSAPADGYELSMYASTPALVWGGIAVAFLVSLVVGLRTTRTVDRSLALLLAGGTFTTVVGLPLIRAYAFYGMGDALTHVGWVRDVMSGRRPLWTLMYPGLHGITTILATIAGVSVWRAMMFVVLAFVVAFVTFIPLIVRELTVDPRATVVAAFGGFMLLPINKVSAHLTGHPSTMGILFVPVVLFVLVKYLQDRSPEWPTPSHFGALLASLGVSLIFIHPQQALNVILVFGTVLGLEWLRRRFYDDAVWLNTLYAQTAVLAAVFVVWTNAHDRATNTIMSYVSILLSSTTPSSDLAQRSSSLNDIGASVLEIYVKLFFVSTVYLALAGILLALILYQRRHEIQFRSLVLSTLGLGLVPVGLLFVVYLAANIGTMYFRQLGYIMSIVTVLGTIAIYRSLEYVENLGHTYGDTVAEVGGTVVVLAMLTLSMVVLYPSPYIYQAGSHVTEQSITGHSNSFETAAPDVEFLGIRQAPTRYREAITGTGTLTGGHIRRSRSVSGSNISTGLASTINQTSYLVVTENDRQREVRAFKGLRYNRSQFERLSGQDGVDRLRDNGGFVLYRIVPTTGTAERG